MGPMLHDPQLILGSISFWNLPENKSFYDIVGYSGSTHVSHLDLFLPVLSIVELTKSHALPPFIYSLVSEMDPLSLVIPKCC